MTKNQLSFFATKNDLESLLTEIEAQLQLKFVETGLFDSSEIIKYNSLLEINDFGQSSTGDHNHGKSYLVLMKPKGIVVRAILQRRGGLKFAVDQMDNSETIIFRPSGIFNKQILIDGQVGTILNDTESLDLYKFFRSEILRQFSKINSYYVGKQAEELLDKGWRLTSSVKSPPLYDLRRV